MGGKKVFEPHALIKPDVSTHCLDIATYFHKHFTLCLIVKIYKYTRATYCVEQK